MRSITIIVFTIITALCTIAFGFYIRDVWVWAGEAVSTLQVPTQISTLQTTSTFKQQEPPTLTYTGTASWYDYSLPDAPNYSKHNDTCASRDYPRGTILLVTAINGKQVTCRVNDYIEHPDRIIDLSSHAFSQLTGLGKGLIEVTIQEL